MDIPTDSERLPTGIAGLDDVLGGGLPRDRLYLVTGDPGVGKTTLALQFLLEGLKRGEKALYITLSETREEITAVARSHGWSLDGVALFELTAAEQVLRLGEENTLFEPSEVDLQEATRELLAQVERAQASRVVLDSLSELRLLAQSPLRYRRQILSFKQFFAGRKSTVLLLDDRTTDVSEGGDHHLESLAHGVLSLEHHTPEYGGTRRRLKVQKLRGVRFRSGYHDFNIETGGIHVFPRLIASEHQVSFTREAIGSGSQELDLLLGGGIDRGTSALFLGPAGAGKSALATHYVVSAAERGEKSAMFIFEEQVGNLYARSEGLGLHLKKYVDAGLVTVRQVNPAELGPGEFSWALRDAVTKDGAKLVVIDSLNGYLNAMPGERFLAMQMHELLAYLGQMGATTIMTMAQHGLVGSSMMSPVDVSYLADTVVMLRYFELSGAVKKALSVVKKRTGPHESSIRELSMSARGVQVGSPLSGFRGVLTGVPLYQGGASLELEAEAGGEPGVE